MNQNKLLSATVQLAGVFAGLLIVGCSDNSDTTAFFPASEERSTKNFMAAQAATGAKADATLQPCHFYGSNLNSLGQQKLDLMSKDYDSAKPLVVYLNIDDKDEALKARRDAVVAYLTNSASMTSDEIEFKSGVNPNCHSLAADGLLNMAKTDSTSDDASASTGSSTGTGGATGSK